MIGMSEDSLRASTVESDANPKGLVTKMVDWVTGSPGPEGEQKFRYLHPSRYMFRR